MTTKLACSSLAFVTLLSLAAAALTGCSTYRVVKRTPNGGEVALQGTQDEAREKADGYMASQCPEGYDILEEGEAVVGQEMTASTTRTRTVFGRPAQTTTASTTDKREWRIKYQCKSAVASKQGAIHELVVHF